MAEIKFGCAKYHDLEMSVAVDNLTYVTLNGVRQRAKQIEKVCDNRRTFECPKNCPIPRIAAASQVVLRGIIREAQETNSPIQH